MTTLIHIIGTSGSGKSTLERGLKEKFKTLENVVSTTTRSPREGEVDGKSYHFKTKEEFKKTDDFLEEVEFSGNLYGARIKEFRKADLVTFVCTPEGALMAKKELKDIKHVVVYFNISKERVVENMLNRGDSEEMINKRLKSDTISKEFKETGLIPDIEITDEDLNGNVGALIDVKFKGLQ
jgi:guanylate kinase